MNYIINMRPDTNDTMKAKDINIGGVIFHIEENGLAVLKDFMTRINNGEFVNSNEIRDCENEITEIFLSMLSKTKLFLSLGDVQEMIDIMELQRDYGTSCSNELENPNLKSQILEIVYQQLGVSRSFYY